MPSRIRSHLDAPAADDSVDLSEFAVRGWVATDAGPASVVAIEVWNAGRVLAVTRDFCERKDVIAALGLPPTARNGFVLKGLSVAENARLTVRVEMNDGSRETIAAIDCEKLKKHKTPLSVLRANLGTDALGVEIGAHVNPVPGLTPFYTDSVAVFAGSEGRVDFLSDGMALPLADDTLDYLCASHVFEHLPNPLGALFEWTRVLRPGGYLYLVVPDKRHTFDHPRATTPVRHLLDDFFLGATAFTRVAGHLNEFVFQTDWRKLRPDCPAGEEMPQRRAAQVVYETQLAHGQHIDIHFHTFTPESLAGLLAAAGFDGGAAGACEIVSWAENYPAERKDGIGVLLRKNGTARHACRVQSFALAHRTGEKPSLPLVCPVTLAPLVAREDGGGRRALETSEPMRYEIRDGVPILLPPPGAKIQRGWKSRWRRTAVYLGARLRAGTRAPGRSPAGG